MLPEEFHAAGPFMNLKFAGHTLRVASLAFCKKDQRQVPKGSASERPRQCTHCAIFHDRLRSFTGKC